MNQLFIFFRRGRGAFSCKTPKHYFESRLVYCLRETDNRLNRFKKQANGNDKSIDRNDLLSNKPGIACILR